MPVNRRVFGAGESPRLSQVEPQGAIEFGGEDIFDIKKAFSVETVKRSIIIPDSPNLDYAWAISQISIGIVVRINLVGSVTEHAGQKALNVKGFAGSQPIFALTNQAPQLYTSFNTFKSITVEFYSLDLTPFTPYPIRGGQQVSLEFESTILPIAEKGFSWNALMFIGAYPSFIYAAGEPNLPDNIETKALPGVMSYRYV